MRRKLKKGMAGINDKWRIVSFKDMIKENAQKILGELPGNVELVAATKGRSIEEILEAIDVGVKIIGENYIQEAEEKFNIIGRKVKWHFIGKLQKNKVKKAVQIFDMIETVASVEIARAIDNVCYEAGKIMPILIEVNSGREENKSGILPENVGAIIKDISELKNIKVMGLMTMGPLLKNPADYRPYFKNTKELFEKIKSSKDIKYLSMGMSDSYNIAIEEGANIVRIGSRIFGPR
jgi:pyridoxal phosphate enzyme (YggS family)